MKKVKELVKEYGTTALGVGLGIVAGGVIGVVSYKAGGRWTELCIGAGLKKYEEAGVIRWFNPDTGLRISAEEACKVVESKFGKVK